MIMVTINLLTKHMVTECIKNLIRIRTRARVRVGLRTR